MKAKGKKRTRKKAGESKPASSPAVSDIDTYPPKVPVAAPKRGLSVTSGGELTWGDLAEIRRHLDEGHSLPTDLAYRMLDDLDGHKIPDL